MLRLARGEWNYVKVTSRNVFYPSGRVLQTASCRIAPYLIERNKMKLTTAFPLITALLFSANSVAQAPDAKMQSNKPMHGMEMKEGMDMKHCKQMMKDHKGMDMKGMDMKGMDTKGMDGKSCEEMMGKGGKGKTSATTGTHTADGTVKKIDAAGKVTMQHGPVKSLGWPAMTMGFDVQDKAVLKNLSVGSKVEFDFSKQGDGYIITATR